MIWIELFSKRLAAVQSYKGVQHFFERSKGLFSKRIAAVQSSVQEVKEFMEGRQNYDKMESFKYCNTILTDYGIP